MNFLGPFGSLHLKSYGDEVPTLWSCHGVSDPESISGSLECWQRRAMASGHWPFSGTDAGHVIPGHNLNS